MEIQIEPGVYVVAVSGGVDSIVLLDLLAKIPNLKLTVAHFDHGIRSDSKLDRQLVEDASKKYGMEFVFAEGKLGANASESEAREARYKFLHSAAKDIGAKAIITAHHRDDVLETAIINMLRGTGRKGLTSLSSQTKLIRPLLKYQKNVIIDYAKHHNLNWREDSSNEDTNYLRNYVRIKILPKFSNEQKQQLLKHIDDLRELNVDIDELVSDLIQPELDRIMFIDLNHATAREVMAGWLRSHGISEIDSKRIELLVRGSKTLTPGKHLAIDKHHQMKINKTTIVIEDQKS